MLEWIFERCAGAGRSGRDSDRLPAGAGAIATEGLDLSADDMAELLKVDVAEWSAEVPLIEAYYAEFGDHVPAALRSQLEGLRKRLEG